MFEQKPTPKQIEANRLNAQKCTGPRSAEGKAVAAMNALRSGIHAESEIIHGEDRAGLEALAAEYHDRWRPSTPEQRLLVDNLVHCEWLLRRFRRIEAELLDFEIRSIEHAAARQRARGEGRFIASQADALSARACHAGVAYRDNFEMLDRLQWRINHTQRIYSRSLEALQHLAQSPALTGQPSQSKPLDLEIGFVPQNLPQPAAQPPAPEPPPLGCPPEGPVSPSAAIRDLTLTGRGAPTQIPSPPQRFLPPCIHEIMCL